MTTITNMREANVSKPKLIESTPICVICGSRQKGDGKSFNHRNPKTTEPCPGHVTKLKVQA